MEKILERIEQVVEKQIEEFEANPVRTGIKLLIFYWIFKQVWREIKR